MPGLPGPPLRLVCPPQRVSTAGSSLGPHQPTTVGKPCPSPPLVSLGRPLLDFGPEPGVRSKGAVNLSRGTRAAFASTTCGAAAGRACWSCPRAPRFGVFVLIRKAEDKRSQKSPVLALGGKQSSRSGLRHPRSLAGHHLHAKASVCCGVSPEPCRILGDSPPHWRGFIPLQMLSQGPV